MNYLPLSPRLSTVFIVTRFNPHTLAIEAIERVPGLDIAAAHVKQQFRDALIEHTRYVREHGEDMPQIRNWVWPYGTTDHKSVD